MTLKQQLHSGLCHSIPMLIAAFFAFMMLSWAFSTVDDQQLVQSITYLSLGSTHFILSYAAYHHYHPKKQPHSVRAALMYTLFYGVVFIAAEVLDKLKRR